MRFRRIVGSVVCALVVFLWGCGGSEPGKIVGVAESCSEAAGLATHDEVVVFLFDAGESHLFAQRILRGRQRFSFIVAPGTYLLENGDGDTADQRVPANVRPGQTVYVSLVPPHSCGFASG
jgi:hypothetical protein